MYFLKSAFWTFIIIPLVLLHNSASAQENQWHKIAVDSLTTLEFPGVPVKNWLKGQWVYELEQGSTVYMAMVKKDSYRVSPTALQLRDYYKGVIKGILQGVGGGKILSQTTFSIAGFEGTEVRFAPLKQLDFPTAEFVRVISIRGTDYCQVFLSADELSNDLETARKRFFASFQLMSPNKENFSIDGKNYFSAADDGWSIIKFGLYGLLSIALFLIALRLSKSKSK